MKRAKLALGCLALGLTALLAACGPGNTLAVGKGSENFRLKAVEANLQKAQDELKAMAGQQQQDDARMAAMQQRITELVALLETQGVKVPAAAPKGSALGVGFAHPEATVAPEAGPAAGNAPTSPQSPPLGGSSGASASQPGPAGHVAGPQPGMPGGLPPAPQPHGAARLAQPSPAEQRARRPGGRVGPAEGPTTPEAAIAADRDASGPAPKAAPAPAPSPTPAEALPAAKAEEASTKPVPPVAGNAETATPAQKAAYNKALQLAINGRNAEAKAAFDQFLAENPNSPLTPNALYWVGEGAFARGEYQTAIADFEKVAKGWPGHHKAADSLYKMAMAQEKAGDVAAARASLERYLKDYPNAELTAVARQKLQALPK